MRVGHLRERLSAALAAAMRYRAADAVALTADRTKAMAVALAGLADDADVEIEALEPPRAMPRPCSGSTPSTSGA